MKTTASIMLLALALAGPAFGLPNWQPLAFGWTWSYDDGTTQIHSAVLGDGNVQGRDVRELRHEVVGVEVYRNYWSRDAAGNVYLHGFYNDTASLARSYDPPVLWLPADLDVGTNWQTAVDVYADLEGFDLNSVIVFSYSVTDHQILDLPAGVFDAWGVTDDGRYDTSAFSAFSVTGRRLDVGKAIPLDRWYSHGVGLVKDGGWVLTGYLPVSNSRAGWSDIKFFYR